jgi:type II secretory pathway component PulJ
MENTILLSLIALSLFSIAVLIGFFYILDKITQQNDKLNDAILDMKDLYQRIEGLEEITDIMETHIYNEEMPDEDDEASELERQIKKALKKGGNKDN